MMQCCAECGSGIFPAVWLLSPLPDFAFTVQWAYRYMLGSDGVVGSVSAGERAKAGLMHLQIDALFSLVLMLRHIWRDKKDRRSRQIWLMQCVDAGMKGFWKTCSIGCLDEIFFSYSSVFCIFLILCFNNGLWKGRCCFSPHVSFNEIWYCISLLLWMWVWCVDVQVQYLI